MHNSLEPAHAETSLRERRQRRARTTLYQRVRTVLAAHVAAPARICARSIVQLELVLELVDSARTRQAGGHGDALATPVAVGRG